MSGRKRRNVLQRLPQRVALAALVGFGLAPGYSSADAVAAGPSAWPDNFAVRVQALALLQTLNAELLSHDSATLTLERWCGQHDLAHPAELRAQRIPGQAKPLPSELRVQLGIGANQPVRYRRVQLSCGKHVLSEADSWYVPARLTAAMNDALDHSDTPFGKVVMPLKFRRKTLSAELLWQPLPAGWENHPPPAPGPRLLRVPAQVLQHRAVLYTGDNLPFAALIETYTDQVLAFPLGSVEHAQSTTVRGNKSRAAAK